MSKLKQIEPEKLLSTLRGQVGEVIQTYIVMRYFQALSSKLETTDHLANFKNQELTINYIVVGKLRDDIIARLSELSTKKNDRINFNSAVTKFGILRSEFSVFEDYILSNNFKDRRNKQISHKELIPKLEDERYYVIKNRTLITAIALSHNLMMEFDIHHYGPAIKKQWHDMRKRRYDLMVPASVKYMLLPHYMPFDANLRK